MPEDKDEKKDALRELQNRIMELERIVSTAKGAEADAVRAIAREEIASLATEIDGLKAALSPKPAEKKEPGLFDGLFGEE